MHFGGIAFDAPVADANHAVAAFVIVRHDPHRDRFAVPIDIAVIVINRVLAANMECPGVPVPVDESRRIRDFHESATGTRAPVGGIIENPDSILREIDGKRIASDIADIDDLMTPDYLTAPFRRIDDQIDRLCQLYLDLKGVFCGNRSDVTLDPAIVKTAVVQQFEVISRRAHALDRIRAEYIPAGQFVAIAFKDKPVVHGVFLS